jgi:hypothetical protein
MLYKRAMSDLWEDLKALREQAIDELCEAEMPETQTLEFKAKSDPATTNLGSEDKKNLGKTLSAFSNAIGGILIWGIAPAKKGEEVSAGKPDPIRQLGFFADRVHGLVGQLITPPNPHVELLPIARADGSGFLAIRVGSSDARPHMSVAADHHRYYLRSGSSTMPMADFLVRDMLRIRTSPKLVLSARFEVGSASNPGTGVDLILTIGNEGTVSARSPYLSVGPDRGSAWVEVHPFSARVTPKRRFFEASALSLHPDLDVDAAKLVFVANKEGGGEATFHHRNYGDVNKCIDVDIRLECRIGCEDTPARRVEVLIPAGAFEDAIDRVLSGRKRVEVGAKHLKEIEP